MELAIALADAVLRDDNGIPYRVNAGEAWAADDPLVVSHPRMFTRDLAKLRRSVEQATAEPGERRTLL
jgi:hypothetical protein